MANKNEKPAAPGMSKVYNLPDRYTCLTAETGGYWPRFAEGQMVEGVFRGAHTMKSNDGKPRDYFQIEIAAPMTWIDAKGVSFEAPAHAVINVDRRAGMEALDATAPGTEIAIVCCGMLKSKKRGTDYWKFKVGVMQGAQ